MSEYISDSDEEYRSLTSNIVSASDISLILTNIPIENRNEAESTLKSTKFAHLLEEINGHNNENISNDNDNDNEIESSTITNNDEIPNKMNPNFNDESTRVIDEEIEDQQEQSENSSRLQAFLESRNENSIRRSLRKRNFSSTHPYLADQAHWLGLASKDHLNQMHEQDTDVGTIVKFLNKIYMKKKKSHPREDKYKAKNFYVFLGKSTAKAQQIIQEEGNSQGSEPYIFDKQSSQLERNSDFTDTNEDIEEEDEEEEEIIFPSRNRLNIDNYSTPKEHNNNLFHFTQDSDSEIDSIKFNELNKTNSSFSPVNKNGESESESDMSDKYVRVGGRFRREKNVLKGLLPESAKRLEIYKPTKKSQNKIDFKKIEYRKGLAIKKKSSRRKDLDDSKDLYNFVDDRSDFSDDPTRYLSNHIDIDINSNLSSILDKTSELSEGYLSIFSEESDMAPNSPIFDSNYTNNVDHSDNIRSERLFHNNENDIIDLTIVEDFNDKKNDYRSNSLRVKTKNTPRISNMNSYRRKKATRIKKQGFGNLKKKSILENSKVKKANKTLELKNFSTNRNSYKKLLDTYTFSREPIQSTLVFEAESSKKFMKSNHLQIRRPPNKLPQDVPFLKKRQSFPQGFILHEIDIEKVWKLSQGNVSFFNLDNLTITLLDEKYYFSLIDKQLSSLNCTKILNTLSSLFRDTIKHKSEILDEIYSCIKSLLKWLLIIQEPYSDNNQQVLGKLLYSMSSIKSKSDGEIKSTFFPYIILIFKINLILVSRLMLDENINLEEKFNNYCIDYWRTFILNYNLDVVTKSVPIENTYAFESVILMQLLFQKKEQWWCSINKALMNISGKGVISMKFDLIFFLASLVSSKDSNWACFFTIYQECKNEKESNNHESFMHIIYALHEKFSWPLEEKLITILYSSITSRKFSNFEDEIIEPELLLNVRSRYEIPNDTFFERFMQLLYMYVSELPFGSNKKRLITKMFTSSNYHYEKGREHYIMFINRLNFIILLTKLSEVDLKNQMYNLVQQIRTSNNISIFEKMIYGLKTYTEIAIEKGNSFPFESFSVLGQTFIDLYTLEPGYLKLWTKFYRIFKEFIQKATLLTFGKFHIEIFQFLSKLDYKSFSDQISLEVCSIACIFLENLIHEKDISLKSDLFNTMVNDYQKTNQKMLNMFMGRFPLSDTSNESRIDRIIENSLKIWINCTFLSLEQNWNILVLQHFPYIGNSFSRSKFALYFYNELLKLADLEYCIDIIISAIMSDLASFHCSKYLPSIIQTLKSKETIYSNYFKNVSYFQVQHIRFKSVSEIIKNISNDIETPIPIKKIYLGAYLKALEKNYNEFFQINDYSEFCKSSIRILEKHCFNLIETEESFISLCNKLGISYNHMKSTWINLNIKQKLVFIHNEISSTIAFNKDFISSLDKYISRQTIDLLYQLLSIYTKAIISNHSIYWHFICCILKYILIKLSIHSIPISESSFRSLLLIIADLPEIADRYNKSDISYYYYLSRYHVYNIYLNAYFIYDGFKDSHFLMNLIENVLDDSKKSLRTDYFASSFSHYNLFDIQPHPSDYNAQMFEHSETEINSIKDSCKSSYENLKILTNSSINSSDGILSFDI